MFRLKFFATSLFFRHKKRLRKIEHSQQKGIINWDPYFTYLPLILNLVCERPLMLPWIVELFWGEVKCTIVTLNIHGLFSGHWPESPGKGREKRPQLLMLFQLFQLFKWIENSKQIEIIHLGKNICLKDATTYL